MSGPLEQRDGKLFIYLKDDYRRVGRAFTRWGFGLGIPFGIAALICWSLHPLAGVFTSVAAVTLGVFGLVGALFWALCRGHVEVDPDAKIFRLNQGSELPFEKIVAVHHSSYVHVQRSNNGTTESLRHQVQVVTSELDREAAAELQAVREALDQAAALEDPSLTREEAAAIQADLSSMEDVFTGAAMLVADHGAELEMWRAAELIARMVDRPLLDFSGQAMLVRTPAELDMPLRVRLARKPEEIPDDPGPPPDGLEVSIRPGSFQASWQGGVLSWLTGPSSPSLQVNELHAVVNPGTRHIVAIPILSLEAVRVATELNNRVVLISDEQMLQCAFKEEEQAVWLGAALTRFIAELPEPTSGPYR